MMTITVRELIDLLKQQDPESDVYAAEAISKGITGMHSISGLSPAMSDHYGAAILLEIEE